MQLYTRHDLSKRSQPELRAMFRKASQALVRSERDSAARRNALASLDNIAAELRARVSGP